MSPHSPSQVIDRDRGILASPSKGTRGPLLPQTPHHPEAATAGSLLLARSRVPGTGSVTARAPPLGEGLRSPQTAGGGGVQPGTCVALRGVEAQEGGRALSPQAGARARGCQRRPLPAAPGGRF